MLKHFTRFIKFWGGVILIESTEFKTIFISLFFLLNNEKIRTLVGMDQMRFGLTGAAPIGIEVLVSHGVSTNKQ